MRGQGLDEFSRKAVGGRDRSENGFPFQMAWALVVEKWNRYDIPILPRETRMRTPANSRSGKIAGSRHEHKQRGIFEFGARCAQPSLANRRADLARAGRLLWPDCLGLALPVGEQRSGTGRGTVDPEACGPRPPIGQAGRASGRDHRAGRAFIPETARLPLRHWSGALQDPDAAVRLAAVEGLGSIASGLARPGSGGEVLGDAAMALIRCLHDPDAKFRLAVIRNLGSIGREPGRIRIGCKAPRCRGDGVHPVPERSGPRHPVRGSHLAGEDLVGRACIDDIILYRSPGLRRTLWPECWAIRMPMSGLPRSCPGRTPHHDGD